MTTDTMLMTPGPGYSPNGWYQIWRTYAKHYSKEFYKLAGWEQEAWRHFAEIANKEIANTEDRISRLQKTITERVEKSGEIS